MNVVQKRSGMMTGNLLGRTIDDVHWKSRFPAKHEKKGTEGCRSML